MKEKALKIIQERLQYLEDNRDRLVIDGDTHPGLHENLESTLIAKIESTPNYYQGRPISAQDLIREMDQAGVHMSNCWQNPATTVYEPTGKAPDEGTLQRNFERLLRANQDIYEISNRYPRRFLPAGWTDPKALGLTRAQELTRMCINEFGFLIVKMNPAQNSYPMDSDMVLEMVDFIVGLGGIPAFHYGGDSGFTPPSALAKIASRHPDKPVVAVHMGGGGSHYVDGDETYIRSREVGLENPNIFYILSAIRDCHIESALVTYQAAGPPFSRNLSCGSDAPYGKLTWNFGGFRAMFASLLDYPNHPDPRVNNKPCLFTDDDVQNYMGRNMVDLYISGYKAMIERFEVAKSN